LFYSQKSVEFDLAKIALDDKSKQSYSTLLIIKLLRAESVLH